jgi:hypothetical protein
LSSRYHIHFAIILDIKFIDTKYRRLSGCSLERNLYRQNRVFRILHRYYSLQHLRLSELEGL